MNRIKELRTKNSLTQRELAKKIGVSDAAINKYEKGIMQPKIDKVKKLSDFFNVSPAYLMGISNLDNINLASNITDEEFSKLNSYDFGIIQYSDFQNIYSETLVNCTKLNLNTELITTPLFNVINSLNLIFCTTEEDTAENIEFIANKYNAILKEIFELVSGYLHLEDENYDIDRYIDDELYTLDFLKTKNNVSVLLDDIFIKNFIENRD